jgi:hypothetical protein
LRGNGKGEPVELKLIEIDFRVGIGLLGYAKKQPEEALLFVEGAGDNGDG